MCLYNLFVVVIKKCINLTSLFFIINKTRQQQSKSPSAAKILNMRMFVC